MINFFAETALAPVGAEVVEHDSYEDEFGYRVPVEYVVIPESAVEAPLPWEHTATALLSTLHYVRSTGREDFVVRFTISHPESRSFIASGWVRAYQAEADIERFLAEHSA